MEKKEPAQLVPPDLKQCQVEKSTYSPFILGGKVHDWKRCPSAAAVLVTERDPGGDGLRGSMTMCMACLQIYQADPKNPPVTFHSIDVLAQG